MARKGKEWGLLLVCSKSKQFSRIHPENPAHPSVFMKVWHTFNRILEINSLCEMCCTTLTHPTINIAKVVWL